jgi:hypothetical protein
MNEVGVGRATARSSRKSVTHSPYPPELRARAVMEAVRSVEARFPYIKLGWSVHTREEVIDRVEAEYARLDRLVSSLSADDFRSPCFSRTTPPSGGRSRTGCSTSPSARSTRAG